MTRGYTDSTSVCDNCDQRIKHVSPTTLIWKAGESCFWIRILVLAGICCDEEPCRWNNRLQGREWTNADYRTGPTGINPFWNMSLYLRISVRFWRSLFDQRMLVLRVPTLIESNRGSAGASEKFGIKSHIHTSSDKTTIAFWTVVRVISAVLFDNSLAGICR